MVPSNLAAEISDSVRAFETSNDQTTRQNAIAAASRLIEELENPAEKLARIGWGEPSRTAALKSAFELGILSKLAEQPLSSAELAQGSSADPQLVARTLKHLAAYGLVKETARDRYAATPFTYATADPTLSGGLIYSFDGMIPAFQGLPSFLAKTGYQVPSNIEHGPVQHGLRTDKSFFQILQEDPRLGSAFNNFMMGYAKARPRWVGYYPIGERLGLGSGAIDVETPLLVDVGGGLGHDISAFHEKFPDLKGQLVLQDTPEVISNTANSSPSLPDAVQAVPHDFFTPQPEEYHDAKAYYLHLVLHDWPDSQAKIILSHIRAAMKPGYSKLLINENVLYDVGAPWQQTSLDWTMMAMLVNRERTETQWRELLAAAGFKITGIWKKQDNPANESLIEALRDDDI